MLCWVYGGGGACSVGCADDDDAVYDGGSLRPCGRGVGSTDIWQYGQYVAKRGLSFCVREISIRLVTWCVTPRAYLKAVATYDA
jgi:hypothetical protein